MDWREILPDSLVRFFYISSGKTFGEYLAGGLDVFPGDGKQLLNTVKNLAIWEREYSRRGFRTIDFGTFIDTGGYGLPITQAHTKRMEGEKPNFHAGRYLEFLVKNKPTCGLGANAVVSGYFN